MVAFEIFNLFIFFLLARTTLVHCDGNIFNVIDYGAIPDGQRDNSQAFLKAWMVACQSKEQGSILVPSGTFLVEFVEFNGPCSCPMVMQINGVLRASADASLGIHNWIAFDNINGLTIFGNGAFDGQGSMAWPHNNCNVTGDCPPLPISIVFRGIKNGSIQGITSLNSKFFHFAINNSEDIRFDQVNISAPGDSPNTDGIHIEYSNKINITNLDIGTGDDCISLGPGSTNVNISNVQCGPGHGVSIGSLGKYQGEKNVNGITVKDCILSHTANGLRIKTWAPSPPSQVWDVTFENITIDSVYNPIIINQEYCPYSGDCTHQGDSKVQISDVKFIDVHGSSASEVSVELSCSKSVPCEGIVLQSLNLTFNGFQEPTIASCSNFNGNFNGPQVPPSCS